jgi:hypothetical protein
MPEVVRTSSSRAHRRSTGGRTARSRFPQIAAASHARARRSRAREIVASGAHPSKLCGPIADTVTRSLGTEHEGAVDPDTVALILLAATDGLQARWLLDPEVDMTQALETLFQIFNAALETPPAGE